MEDRGWSSTESFFFSPLLKLWLLKERKLQKALINGSRDAPALSPSALHNRQTYEAEPGMEYWRNEWKCTQIREPTSPLSTLSPCSLLCIFVEEGLPQESHSLSITEDQRGTEKRHADIKKCVVFISSETTFLWKTLQSHTRKKCLIPNSAFSKGYSQCCTIF